MTFFVCLQRHDVRRDLILAIPTIVIVLEKMPLRQLQLGNPRVNPNQRLREREKTPVTPLRPRLGGPYDVNGKDTVLTADLALAQKKEMKQTPNRLGRLEGLSEQRFRDIPGERGDDVSAQIAG